MKNRKNAFTLLELLVVIGIIGILVAIASTAFTSAQARGRDSKRRGDLQAISKALEQFYAATNSTYPTTQYCTGYETYLIGGAPVDPKFGFQYVSSGNNRSGGSGAFCSSSGTSFCVCVQLEAVNTGNGYGRSASSCTWTGSGNRDYFCVQNQQ